MSAPSIWLNGALVPQADAKASALAHCLHYGTGVFEGIRSYATEDGPAIFRLDDHLERMRKGAELLGIRLDVAALRQGCIDVLHANGLGDAYLRPLAWYERGGLSLDVEPLEAFVLAAALPWKTHLDEGGVMTLTSTYRRNPHQALPALKLCGGYVNAILAKREAQAHGCTEALFVDAEGLVVEATGENVFMVKGGKVTAVEHPDALPGITRATVIELAGAEVRPVSHAELMDADEVFFTGTSAEIAQVGRLDHRTWRLGPITRELRALYLDVVHGRVARHTPWLTFLEVAVG